MIDPVTASLMLVITLVCKAHAMKSRLKEKRQQRTCCRNCGKRREKTPENIFCLDCDRRKQRVSFWNRDTDGYVDGFTTGRDPIWGVYKCFFPDGTPWNTGNVLFPCHFCDNFQKYGRKGEKRLTRDVVVPLCENHFLILAKARTPEGWGETLQTLRESAYVDPNSVDFGKPLLEVDKNYLFRCLVLLEMTACMQMFPDTWSVREEVRKLLGIMSDQEVEEFNKPKIFTIAIGPVKCDECGVRLASTERRHECRACNYDACEKCFQALKDSETESTVHVLAHPLREVN